MGAELRYRPSAFEESLDSVRRLLAGETVSSARRFTFTNARLALRPREPVEFWIGATADPAIDRAARLADGWLASPSIPPEEARAQVTYYRDRCRAHGRTPAVVAIRRDIYVAESTAEAEATAGPILGRGYRGFDPAALIAGTRRRGRGALPRAGGDGLHRRDRAPPHERSHAVLGSLERLAAVRAALRDVERMPFDLEPAAARDAGLRARRPLQQRRLGAAAPRGDGRRDRPPPRARGEIGGYEAAEREDAAIERFYGAVGGAARLRRPTRSPFVENATRAWDMAFYALPFAAGDRILTARAEYASNVIAFLQVAERTGAVVEVIPNDETGQISVDALRGDDRRRG